jgi:hypothetical protein
MLRVTRLSRLRYARAMQGGPQGFEPTPQKKGLSTLAIVLIVLSVVLVLVGGTCAVGLLWVQRTAKSLAEDVKDGGLVLVSPPEVRAELAAAKKDYVGSWTSSGGSSLSLDASGNLDFKKHEPGGASETVTAPVARFEGNDLVVKPFITFTLHVTEPPHRVGDRYQMTVDGIRFTR